MSEALITAGVLALALLAYAVSGGADYGAGVLELLSAGPRREAQRRLIAHAIGPIWEANHVWLILIVVLLFVGFPEAFAELSIKLHIPLTLMLVGVVMRGSAFVFRAYDPERGGGRAYGRVFAITSVLTPVMLGTALGSAASGRLAQVTDFTSAWLAPFPFLCGAMVLVLFTLTAAVYLTCEAEERALADDFRARALGAVVVLGGASWAALLSARGGAPRLYASLVALRPSALLLQGGAALLAVGLALCLWSRRYAWARLGVLALSTVMVGGLCWAQYPYILYPDYPVARAAPVAVLRPVLVTLLLGAMVLGPALYILFRVFKGPWDQEKKSHEDVRSAGPRA